MLEGIAVSLTIIGAYIVGLVMGFKVGQEEN